MNTSDALEEDTLSGPFSAGAWHLCNVLCFKFKMYISSNNVVRQVHQGGNTFSDQEQL